MTKLTIMLLAILIGAGCSQSFQQEKEAETIIDKALKRLDPEGIIQSRKSFYISGQEEGRMVKAPSTENYPKRHNAFEHYDDPEHFYSHSARGTRVSSPQGSWSLISPGQGVKFDGKFLNYMNLISFLKEIQHYTLIRDSEHPEKLCIIAQEKPFYKVYFTPDHRVEKIKIGNVTVLEYSDYKTIAGGYLPTKIVMTATSSFSIYQQTWTIEKIEAGFKPNPAWFEKPSVLQSPSPILTIGNWKNAGMMSRNLAAMREIYGQELKFCLNLSFRNPDDAEILMNQLTFANEESAERYLKKPVDDEKIAARWRIGKFVQELKSPMTPGKQAFMDEIKRRQEIVRMPGMPE